VTNFWQANHLNISPSHAGRLSFLSSAGWEMNIGQNAAMLCSWGVKAGWLIPYVDKCVGGSKTL